MIMKGRNRFIKMLSSFILSKVQLHHLLRAQSSESICFARIVAKLNFKDTVLPLLNNGSYFATSQAFGIQIFNQGNDVKQFDFLHTYKLLLGLKQVVKRGKSSSFLI